LIDVPEKNQSFGSIADIANLQREVVGESVLHAEVPTGDAWVLKVRVDRHEVARNGGRTTDPTAGWKDSAIPVER
jgi:hypothetical protein